MTLTPKLLAELAAIELNGRVQPQTPEQHAVVNELFDYGLLIIHPAGAGSTYELMPEARLLLQDARLAVVPEREHKAA